jgi:hypothetical protein
MPSTSWPSTSFPQSMQHYGKTEAQKCTLQKMEWDGLQPEVKV